MSSIYLIDYYSNNIRSLIHQASPLAKLIFLFLILVSIILSKSLSSLVFILGIIVVLFLIAKLPFLKIGKWALYPAFFALIFALSQIQYGLLPLQTLLRAITVALLVLLFVCTTPYPVFFSLLGRFSRVFANVLFMTYRYFFLIIDKLQTKIKLMKIRGVYAGGIWRSFKNIGALTAQLFIHSLEKSEKVYNLLLIRGYQGVIFSRISYKFKLSDLLLIGLGLIILMVAITP